MKTAARTLSRTGKRFAFFPGKLKCSDEHRHRVGFLAVLKNVPAQMVVTTIDFDTVPKFKRARSWGNISQPPRRAKNADFGERFIQMGEETFPARAICFSS
jgi:hypothetical protein